VDVARHCSNSAELQHLLSSLSTCLDSSHSPLAPRVELLVLTLLPTTTTHTHTHTHTHTGLATIVTGEPGLAGWPFDFPPLFVPDLCILSGQTKTFHILFITISSCPSQTEEGDGGKGTRVEGSNSMNGYRSWFRVFVTQ